MQKPKLFLYIFIIHLFFLNACSQENKIEHIENKQHFPFANQIDTLLHDEFIRSYKLFVPESYSHDSNVALIIALHGYGNTASEMEKTCQLNKKAEAEGFIVVYPDGIDISDDDNSTQAWNTGGYFNRTTKNVDDVGFISQIIDLISKHYSIDQNKVFATGFSNGASMAYRLGIELSCKIAAIAPHSGYMTFRPKNIPDCKIPVLHLHGLEDGIVPFNQNSEEKQNSIVEVVLNKWALGLSCNQQPDTLFTNTEYLIKQWSCPENNSISLYLSKKGRHDWFTNSNSGIEANNVIWDFFKENKKTSK